MNKITTRQITTALDNEVWRSTQHYTHMERRVSNFDLETDNDK